jgi:hypothetical protein
MREADSKTTRKVKKKGKAIPVTGRGGLWELEAPTSSKQSAHRWW